MFFVYPNCFDSTKRAFESNSKTITVFKQTLKDVENSDRDIAGFDLSYDEDTDFCRKKWKDKDHNILHIDRSKRRIEKNEP